MSEYRRRDDHGREGNARPSHRRPLEVIVDERGVESALRAFKRLVLRDGILRELKRKIELREAGGAQAPQGSRGCSSASPTTEPRPQA